MKRDKMHIGLNTLFLVPGDVGGTETYARGIIGALEKIDKRNDYVVFCNRENYNSFKLKSKNFRKVLCPINADNRPFRILWEQLIFPFWVWRNKIDVLLSLGYVCPLFVPCSSIVLIFDLNWFFHPEEFSLLKYFVQKNLVTLSAKRANGIITTSENSKSDISSVLKISKSIIWVIYGGIDRKIFRPIKDKKKVSAVKKKYGIQGRFILTASSSYKFKNLGKLIDAFSLFVQDNPGLQLLIGGLGGKGKPEIISKIEGYNLKGKVIDAGWIPWDKDLPTLYSSAEMYVHSSLYEGFGFPVLEAMACGCPVVSSKSASLPELVGNVGILVDATKKENLAGAMKDLIRNTLLIKRLRIKGISQSKNFSWEKAARETLRVFKMIEAKHIRNPFMR